MKQTAQELIEYFENYNRHRLYSILDRHHGSALDQAIHMLKRMTWQPMETAPKDQEFLGVWGAKDPPPTDFFDVFRYDEDQQKFAFSNHGATIYLPSETYGPWAWMEIPKYEP